MGLTMGRYELMAPLGRGGMAEVFLARRRAPGGVEKRLVVKRIRPERQGDARFHQMFVEEARLSMSFAHKNIVSVFDFGRAGDELFLAMEFVEGRDLARTLARGRARLRPPEPAVVAYIAMEACQALDYVQRVRDEGGQLRAIVHRDVSPRNLMLSFSGEVKLVDFGVANASSESIASLLGTPAYMSPEQTSGEETVDVRTDLFSLGLVMWEALAGETPYGGGGVEEVLRRARAAEVPPLPDSVPPALAAVVARATRPERAERYQTAREMQLALDQYLVGERARSGGAPPEVSLADWLAELFPDRTPAAAAGELRPPEGPLVTFLDDGAEAIDRVSSLVGDRTARSVADTMPAALAKSTSSARPRRARWIGGAIALAALAAMVTVSVSWSRGSSEDERHPSSERPAAPEPRAQDTATPAPRVPEAPAPAAQEEAALPVRHEPPSARVRPGTVKVSASPWARVRVVGRKERCVETPCSLTLPPGRHTLSLENPHQPGVTLRKIQVESGQTSYVQVTLQEPG